MTKDQFMKYCWKKKLSSSEMFRHGIQLDIPPESVPTRSEYLQFYKDADEFLYPPESVYD